MQFLSLIFYCLLLSVVVAVALVWFATGTLNLFLIGCVIVVMMLIMAVVSLFFF